MRIAWVGIQVYNHVIKQVLRVGRIHRFSKGAGIRNTGFQLPFSFPKGLEGPAETTMESVLCEGSGREE